MFGRKQKPSVVLEYWHPTETDDSDGDEGDDQESAASVIDTGPTVAVMERAKAAIETIEETYDRHGISQRIDKLEQAKKRLFGVEARAALRLSEETAALQYQLRLARAQEIAPDRKRVSPEVLSWRKSELTECWYGGRTALVRMPSLALFSIDEAKTQLSFHGVNWIEPFPYLPEALVDHYRDLAEALAPLRDPYSVPQLSTTFEGVIPAETREKISEAKSSRAYDSIALLAEANWAFDMTPDPYYADPIVVGLVGSEMWVIDIFDPTPIEEYIAQEFTS